MSGLTGFSYVCVLNTSVTAVRSLPWLTWPSFSPHSEIVVVFKILPQDPPLSVNQSVKLEIYALSDVSRVILTEGRLQVKSLLHRQGINAQKAL